MLYWAFWPGESVAAADAFWGACPPSWMIRIMKFRSFSRHAAQFLRYLVSGRGVYVILFFVAAGLVLVGIATSGEKTGFVVNTTQTLSGFLNVSIIKIGQTSYYPSTVTISFIAMILSLFTLNGLLQVLSMYIIVLMVYWIWKYRSVMVIDDFENHVDDSRSGQGKGISHLLLAELNRVNQLYSDVVDQRPLTSSAGQTRQVSAVLKADDPGEALGKSCAASSSVEVGSIKFPTGIFVSIFNLLGRGPRIRGSIRRGEDNSLVIVGTCSGFHSDFGWVISSRINADTAQLLFPEKDSETVPCAGIKNGIAEDSCKTEGTEKKEKNSQPAVEPGSGTLSVEQMVQVLASRIITDIPAGGSFRWEATMLFNKGLIKYRECLRTPREQTTHFREAEEYFQKAIIFDSKFTTAWYNLGIIYSELGMDHAAETAFEKAIELEPGLADAYYARALVRFTRYHRALFCDDESLLPTEHDYYYGVCRFCEQGEALLKHFERPLEKLRYRLAGWAVPGNYSGQLAQILHLRGQVAMDQAMLVLIHARHAKEKSATATTPSDAAKKSSILKPGDDRKILDQLCDAARYFTLATIAAWKGHYRLPRYGNDDDYYLKRREGESYRFLATCLGCVGWAWTWYYVQSAEPAGSDPRERKGLPGPVDPEYIYRTACTLDPKIYSDSTCAELHARLGIWYLIRIGKHDSLSHGQRHAGQADQKRANDAFWTAIRINPGIMKYHLFSSLNNELERVANPKPVKSGTLSAHSCSTPAAERDQDPCVTTDMGLKYALAAYRNQHFPHYRDIQWMSVRETELMFNRLEAGNSDKEPTPRQKTLEKFFIMVNHLHEFCRSYVHLEERLDFYTVSYPGQDYDREVHKALRNLYKKITTNVFCLRKCGRKICRMEDWMKGNTFFLEGRWRYYQADYGRYMNASSIQEKFFLPCKLKCRIRRRMDVHTRYDCPEAIFRISRTFFSRALDCLDDIPDENIEPCLTRLALIDTFSCSHEYPSAFFLGGFAHALNPTGDFEHVILGLQASEIRDNSGSAELFTEALQRAYDLQDFPQYLMNQYYRRQAFSYFYMGRNCPGMEDEYRKKIMRTLAEASCLFGFCYQFYVNSQPCYKIFDISGKTEMPTLRKREHPGTSHEPGSPRRIDIPATMPYLFSRHIEFQRHQATEYLHRIMAVHAIRGYYLHEYGEYDLAVMELTIVNQFYRPHHNKTTSIPPVPPQERSWKPEPGSRSVPGQWFREYLITTYCIAHAYRCKKESDNVLKYTRIICQYQAGLRKCIDCEPFWIRLWLHISPTEILVSAMCWEMEILLDTCSGRPVPPGLNGWIKDTIAEARKVLEMSRKYSTIAPFACNTRIQEDLEGICRQKTAELDIIEGRIRLMEWLATPENSGADPKSQKNDIIPQENKSNSLQDEMIESGNANTVAPENSATSAGDTLFRIFDPVLSTNTDIPVISGVLRALETTIQELSGTDPKRDELIRAAGRYYRLTRNRAIPESEKAYLEQFAKTLGDWKSPVAG